MIELIAEAENLFQLINKVLPRLWMFGFLIFAAFRYKDGETQKSIALVLFAISFQLLIMSSESVKVEINNYPEPKKEKPGGTAKDTANNEHPQRNRSEKEPPHID